VQGRLQADGDLTADRNDGIESSERPDSGSAHDWNARMQWPKDLVAVKGRDYSLSRTARRCNGNERRPASVVIVNDVS
jgi:hypothetical protein